MKIKTSELTGAALDWVVAKCEDLHTGYPGYWSNSVLEAADRGTENPFAYSTNWAQGGPIIERECISLTQFKEDEVDPIDVGAWCAAYDREDFGDDDLSCTAPTPLIAAMRCLVSSKLGDEVDVPEELCQQPNN